MFERKANKAHIFGRLSGAYYFPYFAKNKTYTLYGLVTWQYL